MASKYISEEDVKDLLLPYAIQYVKDIDSASMMAIYNFYKDYNPILYKRKFGLVKMWETIVNPISFGWSIKTTYSSDFFGASHRSDDAVFNWSFLGGYHGGPFAWGKPKKNLPKMSPSPYELVEKYWASYSV